LKRELWNALKIIYSQALMVHTYDPSYSRGRDQEDCSSKPSQANSSQSPILKIPNTQKRGTGGVTQEVEHLPSKREALSSNPEFKKFVYKGGCG
jgi:hypothetical protein